METPLHQSTEQIEDAIERLKNGTATHDDVALVKEYLGLVEEMMLAFEDSVQKVNTKDTT